MEWFKEQGYSIPEPSSPGTNYAQYLEELSKKDPQAFICHFYNTYFAHTAGGRMIGKKVNNLYYIYICISSFLELGPLETISTAVITHLRVLDKNWLSVSLWSLEAFSFSYQVAEMILDNKELEFYKWNGDLSQLLQNVREKINRVAQVIFFHLITLAFLFCLSIQKWSIWWPFVLCRTGAGRRRTIVWRKLRSHSSSLGMFFVSYCHEPQLFLSAFLFVPLKHCIWASNFNLNLLIYHTFYFSYQ